jgi:DUF1009 family protein
MVHRQLPDLGVNQARVMQSQVRISVETSEMFDALVRRADVLRPERTSPLGSQNINRARALGDE